MSTQGIAVIGTGYIGGEHIRVIAAHEHARLEVICSTQRSREAAANLSQTHGAARTTTSYEDVLSDPRFDIVYLCTPNSRHEDQAVAALGAGKHVFVEKPLAVTVAGCRRIVDAARSAGRQVMVGHGARFSRIFVTIHKLVRDGTLGEPCFVEGDYVHDLGPFLDLPGHDWWMDVEDEGQLPIIGGACHPLDLMRWIAGEIVEVSAYGARRNLPGVPWYDTIISSLKFESGAVGKCLVCCGAKVPYAMNLSYYGTKGTVINDRLFLDGIPHVEEFMRLPVTIRAEDHTCAEELDQNCARPIDPHPAVDIEDETSLVATTVKGVMVDVALSFHHKAGYEWIVAGTQGVIRLASTQGELLVDDEKVEPAEEVNLPGESSIHDEFFTAIRDQRPLAQAAGADVRHSVALVCAAQESGRTGQVVTVG